MNGATGQGMSMAALLMMFLSVTTDSRVEDEYVRCAHCCAAGLYLVDDVTRAPDEGLRLVQSREMSFVITIKLISLLM